VLTSGPPHAAIDKGCLRRDGEAAYWYDAGTSEGFDAAYGAGRGVAGPCTRHDAGTSAAWRGDGVATGGSSYAWPGTAVTFLFGDRDTTVAPAHGADLAARLRSAGTPVTTRVVAGMGHEVAGTPAGRSALAGVLTGGG
jgi:acetyl esterase/lipase